MKQNENKAMLLSIVPGLGQFYNRQKQKGIIFLLVFAAFIAEIKTIGFSAILKMISLGDTPKQDNSLFLLIQGTLQIIICLIFLVFYIANIYDAKKVASLWNSGVHVNLKTKEIIHNIGDKGFPYLLTIPAYFIMIFIIVFPVLVTIFIAFTNYDFKHIPPANLIDWIGAQNFSKIFTFTTYKRPFGAVFSWTIIWTLCATTLQIALGVLTAVVCHQKFIRCKRIFGIIFLLPWAVPAFITILTFSNMFNDSIGAINTQIIPLLNNIPFVNIGAIAWKTNPFWTKTAIIMIQGWLGFPYIYVMTTSILQSISDDLYEAAEIDGASSIQKFRRITLPTILLVAAPTFITQYTGNFNNFSMIYLFNEGGPGSVGGGAGATDILISWIYKLTTGVSPEYSVAATITLIISAIVIMFSLILFKKTKAFNMGD